MVVISPTHCRSLNIVQAILRSCVCRDRIKFLLCELQSLRQRRPLVTRDQSNTSTQLAPWNKMQNTTLLPQKHVYLEWCYQEIFMDIINTSDTLSA